MSKGRDREELVLCFSAGNKTKNYKGKIFFKKTFGFLTYLLRKLINFAPKIKRDEGNDYTRNKKMV